MTTETVATGMDIPELIWELEAGDKIAVFSTNKGMPHLDLTVTKTLGDEVTATDAEGREYTLLDEYWGPNDRCGGWPWLRNAAGSQGEIRKLVLVEPMLF